MSEIPTQQITQMLSVKTLAAMLGKSERSIWRMLSKAEIPKPIKVGGSTRWRCHEIEDWISNDCPPGTQQ